MKLKDILTDIFDMMEKVSEVDPKKVVLTGYHEIDKLAGGLKSGELSLILAGEEGLGRAFSQNIIINQLDLAVLIISTDISKEQYGLELLSIKSQVHYDTIRLAAIDQTDWDKLARATDDLSRSNIQIIDQRSTTVEQIRSESEKADNNEPLNLIAIDGSGKIKDFAKELKIMAKTLNVPVVAVLNSNICNSEMIECAGLVIELEDAWKLAYIAVVEVNVSKNATGLTGTVGLNYTEEFTRFEPYNTESDSI
jgi:replicative DNA helicase